MGRTYRQDFKLDVGAPTEQVEVRAESPILKTEAAELGQVIDNQKINSLPLNQRDVFGTLGSLTPGVQPTRGTDAGGSGVQFNVKGMRQSDNYGMIDGSMVSETNGSLQFFINPDAVQEFEVKTGLYGAEYGIKPGGQFSLITKSGTNDLHGTAYWLLRNDNLDARNFFDPGPRPEFKRNQYGAVAGGPIVFPKLFDGKDKAWWFFAYSGESVRRLLSLTGNVPTDGQEGGAVRDADHGSAHRAALSEQHDPDQSHRSGRSKAAAVLAGSQHDSRPRFQLHLQLERQPRPVAGAGQDRLQDRAEQPLVGAVPVRRPALPGHERRSTSSPGPTY